MKVVVLGSGSKGNSVYIETDAAKILIDAGLTYQDTKNRLLDNNIFLNNLDAIFITHEHIDHTKGLDRIAGMCDAKIYINQNTFYNLRSTIASKINYENVYFIVPDSKYLINDLYIVPISLSHDAVNCYGFLLKSKSSTYAHITDTGKISKKYLKLLRLFDTILIESNHDVDLLLNSNRPQYLKQRILSTKGHLSNEECSKYLKEIVSESTKRVILAHLSEECNTEEIAKDEIKNSFGEKLTFELFIAKQRVPLKIIHIGEDNV